MALTKENRQAVKNFIWSTLMTEHDKMFNTTQLRFLVHNGLNIDLSPQAIGSIMTNDAPKKYYLMRKEDRDGRAIYGFARVNAYTLKKERSQVFFINNETGSKTLIYDYNAPVEEEGIDEFGIGRYDTVTFDDSNLTAYTVARIIRVTPEWVFSYPDLFSSIMEGSNYCGAESLPRTLLPREREVSEKIYEIMSNRWRYSLCSAFNDAHKLMTDKNFDINIFNTLTKNQLKFVINYELIRRFDGLKNALMVMSMINKFALIQIKNYEQVPYNSMVDELKEMYDFNWLSNVNTNHSFKANEEVFEAYKQKEKNNILAKKLQKLNFLNGLEVGNDYVIVVPQTIEDLVSEGHQQNNCVGHYYNNSIITGDNNIYFIRNKSNTRKSYITCRFNNRNRATVEYRHKNNEYRDHHKLISAIDAIINENLKGE
jgi:hypothetical protein